MALARWEPFKELARMQEEFNRLFDDRLWRMRTAPAQEELGAGFYPAIDIYEDSEAVMVTAELPGMEPKEVDVRVENGVLTIAGERKLEREDKKENYRRLERSYGTFSRSFSLPPTMDTDKVKAEFRNGLLKIQIPKREESKPRTIRVQVQ